MKWWLTQVRGILLILGGLVALLLTAFVVGAIWQQHREGKSREEGERVVKWIYAEQRKTGRFPDSLAGSGLGTSFHWNYSTDDTGTRFFMYAYFSPVSRVTMEYDSHDGWRVNRDG